MKTKTIGICAHSYEGGALCFLTACREGSAKMGAHLHPTILLSAIPMGWSMPGWESGNYETVGRYLKEGVEQVARAGADFFICPDNTAHLVLEKIIHELPVPGLHIAGVVCDEIEQKGWKKVGLLGTRWTMTGSVYADALEKRGLTRITPDETLQAEINRAIFEELCVGVFLPATVNMFITAIKKLQQAGAECVILGCTEIPLIITKENSPLPILDSTRLLARHAVRLALTEQQLPQSGWI
ncbi:MAG: amino acid racemase [Saprospiraceae bacterium]|nr:amino acid racemase [Saprospiraceae bacterium]